MSAPSDPMPDDVRARVIVHGRVQGVWFRESTRREASARDLHGWVRNHPGGTVEAVFQGPREAVEALIAFCRVGPPAAEVTRLEISWEGPQAEDADFQVLRQG